MLSRSVERPQEAPERERNLRSLGLNSLRAV
jgi:hypothetical protein